MRAGYAVQGGRKPMSGMAVSATTASASRSTSDVPDFSPTRSANARPRPGARGDRAARGRDLDRLAAEPTGAASYVPFAETLDRAAEALGIDYIAGFSALVEKGMTPGDQVLIESIPAALSATDRKSVV